MSDTGHPCDEEGTGHVPDPRDAIIADLALRLDQSEQRFANLTRQLARQTEEIAQLSKDALQIHMIGPAAGKPGILRRASQMFDRARRKLGRKTDP